MKTCFNDFTSYILFPLLLSFLFPNPITHQTPSLPTIKTPMVSTQVTITLGRLFLMTYHTYLTKMYFVATVLLFWIILIIRQCVLLHTHCVITGSFGHQENERNLNVCFPIFSLFFPPLFLEKNQLLITGLRSDTSALN